MDTERGFRDAAREDPDDDLHRLAWADWLDDHGDEARAEFLRAGVHASRLSLLDPRRHQLEEQADSLLDQHEEQWLGPIADLAMDWRWERGCVERATLSVAAAVEAGDALFDAAPLHTLRIIGGESGMAALSRWPGLARLSGLDLGTRSTDGDPPLPGPPLLDAPLSMVLDSPHLGPLASLRLAGHLFCGSAIHGVIEGGRFSTLRSLDLSGCGSIGNRAAISMASKPAPLLESLDLWGTNLSEHGLRDLLGTPKWPRMERLVLPLDVLYRAARRTGAPSALPSLGRIGCLRLNGTPFDALSLRELLHSPGLGPISDLRLIGASLNENALAVIAEWPGLVNVRRLDLSGNALRDAALSKLAESPYLRALEWLDLSDNRFGAPGLESVLSSPAARALGRLALSTTYVGRHSLELLTPSALPRLRCLELEGVGIAGTSAARLADSSLLPRLRELRLNGNNLQDDGLLALSDRAPRLRRLTVARAWLDTPSLSALLEGFPRLRWLDAANNQFSDSEKETLRARFKERLSA